MFSHCIIEPCEVINVSIGLITGFIISYFTALFYDRRKARNYRIRYGRLGARKGKLSAMYEGYDEKNNPISTGLIYHVAENKLELQVTTTANNDVWQGFITMYSDEYGKVEYLYRFPEEKIGQMGSKYIKIFDVNTFQLIHEANKGFGRETFRRIPFAEETWWNEMKRFIGDYVENLGKKIKPNKKP